jgi:serine/threonine protein kinase
MAQDLVFKQGFLREAWIGERMRSRWTVRYIDLPPERRSALYLVMPFYRGVTLVERLDTPPPATIAEGVGVGLALCDAIEDLAQKQVVHADIKPENIFLLSSGEIKLLDLGLAAPPDLDDAETDRLGGTTRYMAPELVRGSKSGPTSEVFSLGVTLYRLFSGGAFPFGQREATPLARLRPDLPRWLGGVLARAIAADPAARYADVGALRAELLHGLAHEDWRGPPPQRHALGVDFWRWAAIALAFGTVGLAFLAWHR